MILLVGAGAVGTVLAAHLGAAGTPYRLYARDKDRAAFAAAGEIRVEAAQPQQPALVAPPPQLASTLALDGIDTVLICVKYPALDALLGQLPAIPAGCSVVSTLNGAEALRTIRARLPQARVLPLTVMYNAQLLGPLHAQLTTRAEIIVGDGDAALAARFAGPGMSTKTASGDSAVWGKLLINLANAVCAATHTTFKDLLTQRDLRAIYVAVLDEATSLLRAPAMPINCRLRCRIRCIGRSCCAAAPCPGGLRARATACAKGPIRRWCRMSSRAASPKCASSMARSSPWAARTASTRRSMRDCWKSSSGCAALPRLT